MPFAKYCEHDGSKLEPLLLGKYDVLTGEQLQSEHPVKMTCPKCGGQYTEWSEAQMAEVREAIRKEVSGGESKGGF